MVVFNAAKDAVCRPLTCTKEEFAADYVNKGQLRKPEFLLTTMLELHDKRRQQASKFMEEDAGNRAAWLPFSSIKQIQTPRYIVQNSMNLKQYRHRPSHDSSQCFNLFPASAEKIRKTYRLRKRVFGKKIPRENNVQFIQTILSRSKCFILNLIPTEKSPSENSNDF